MGQMYRTWMIHFLELRRVIEVYEAVHDEEHARIDSAVPQAWFDENIVDIRRRHGAVWLYNNESPFGKPMFVDELLSDLGIMLGYKEAHGE